LNERSDDIPLLAKHFLELICNDYGIASKQISDEAIKLLQTMNWSGNIREFRNVIERLIILSDKQITKQDIELYALPIGRNI
jgi:DNA-binding NtrC family response regulator